MPKSTRRLKKSDTTKKTAVIKLTVYDGTRHIFPGKDILVRVRDGRQEEIVSRYVNRSSVTISVPFSDNFMDNYTVLVTSDEYRDAGFFPIKVSPFVDSQVDLMLVPKRARYTFLPWVELKNRYPRYASFLCCAGDEQQVQRRYADLTESKPAVLASLLNLTAAMSSIQLPSKTPLDYFKRIEWSESLEQDRFFGFADQELVQQVKSAAQQGMFVPEPAPGLFHGDATSSFKQVQFGEANVQVTFHERTSETIGGVRCVRVEPDIDYYKDLGAHALLEVISNTLSRGLTDPQVNYVLRWIAGRHAGVPEFDPSYTLT